MHMAATENGTEKVGKIIGAAIDAEQLLFDALGLVLAAFSHLG